MSYYGYYRGRKLCKQRNREINRGLISLFPRTIASFGMAIGVVMLVAGIGGAGIGGVVFALAILVPSILLFAGAQAERRR